MIVTSVTRVAASRTSRWVVMSAAMLMLTVGGTTARAQADSADLGVAEGQVTVSTVNPSVVTTFWEVANNGPATATDVMLVITLPTGTSLTSAFVQAGIPDCTFDAASRQVSCAIGALANGSSNSATVVFANTGNPEGTVLTVQAQLVSTTPDPSESNNTASASVTLQSGPLPTVPDGPSANLGLASVVPAQPPAGSSSAGLWWTLFNAGPDAAEGVTVEFTLPEGVDYISADIAARTPPCPFDPVTRQATCVLPGTLGSGLQTAASVQFSLEGVVTGTPITVVATVRAETVDPDPTDNVRSNTLVGAQVPATTTVGPPTGAIPATGAPSPTIPIIAALVLAAGTAMIGTARRTRL